MVRYMVIKIYADGTQKAEFIEEHDVLQSYLKSLREIERAYKLFAWSNNSNGYFLMKEWNA